MDTIIIGLVAANTAAKKCAQHPDNAQRRHDFSGNRQGFAVGWTRESVDKNALLVFGRAGDIKGFSADIRHYHVDIIVSEHGNIVLRNLAPQSFWQVHILPENIITHHPTVVIDPQDHVSFEFGRHRYRFDIIWSQSAFYSSRERRQRLADRIYANPAEAPTQFDFQDVVEQIQHSPLCGKKEVNWLAHLHDGLLGDGNFGHVDRVVHRWTGVRLAKKTIHMRKFREQEVLVWRELRHPNIAQFLGFTRLDHEMSIFSELYDGSVTDLLGGLPSLSSSSVFMRQLWADQVGALAYLERQGVIHRDIKPSNMLYKKDPSRGQYPFITALTDFGLCQDMTKVTGTICGTDIYMAPEIHLGGQQSCKSDVYSLGISLLVAARILDEESQQCNRLRLHYLVYLALQKEPSLAPMLEEIPSKRASASSLWQARMGLHKQDSIISVDMDREDTPEFEVSRLQYVRPPAHERRIPATRYLQQSFQTLSPHLGMQQISDISMSDAILERPPRRNML